MDSECVAAAVVAADPRYPHELQNKMLNHADWRVALVLIIIK